MNTPTKRAAGHTAPGAAAPSRTSPRPPTARRDSRPPERVLGTAREAGNPARAGEAKPPALAGPTDPGAAAATWGSELHAAPGTKLLAAAMSEDDLERGVRRILKDLGLRLAYHPWKYHARRAREGFPDWTITGLGGLIFRELKREGEEPTPAQQAWLDSLSAAGVSACVWRPSDLLSGRVARELAGIAGMRLPPGGESP